MQDDKAHFHQLVHKKLSGEATAADLQQLENLLRRHPDWLYTMEQLAQLWELPVRPPRPAAAEAAFEKHLHRLQQAEAATALDAVFKKEKKQYKTLKNPFVLSAAAFVLLFLLVITLYQQQRGTKGKTSVLTNEVYAHAGSKTKMDLPDGTVVWLNADSKLTYDNQFGKQQRKVTLVGEAYFDVTTDKDKAFVVQTDLMQIKVLGTVFNVKAYPHEAAEASLIEGSIQASIAQQKESILLKPHQKLIVPQTVVKPAQTANEGNKDAATAVAHVLPVQFNAGNDSTLIETAWLHNKLVFKNEAFSNLALRLERWYGIKIVLEDEALQQLRFTGSFQNENLQQVLMALKITGQFQYNIKKDSVFISSPNSKKQSLLMR